MKDIQTPLRSAYFSIITGEGLTCYENGSVPDEALKPYVIISDMSSTEDSNKSNFGHTVITLLDIVTEYDKNDLAGSKPVDLLAGKIFAKINSKTIMNIGPGLQVVTTRLIQDKKTNTVTDNQRTYRRLLRYQQLIMEV